MTARTVDDIATLIREIDPHNNLTAQELGWEIAAPISNGVEDLESMDVAYFVAATGLWAVVPRDDAWFACLNTFQDDARELGPFVTDAAAIEAVFQQ